MASMLKVLNAPVVKIANIQSAFDFISSLYTRIIAFGFELCGFKSDCNIVDLKTDA